MGNTYEEFAARYNSQWEAVYVVAQWLHRHVNTEVTIFQQQLRKKHERPEDYFDSGDIRAVQNGIEKIVEVKHDKKHDYKNMDDYPYADIAIVGKKSFDRNSGHVTAYVRVNKSMTHAFIMPTKHKNKWKLERKWMSNTEQYEEMYVCPKEFATICEIG